MTEEKTQQEIKKMEKIIEDLSKRVKFLEEVNKGCIYLYTCQQIVTGVPNN